MLIFLGGKLVDANFYAFCNYVGGVDGMDGVDGVDRVNELDTERVDKYNELGATLNGMEGY